MRLRPAPTRASRWGHLPGRTVRARLTFLYGGLLLASSAVLLVLTGLLWGGATAGHYQFSAKVPVRIIRITTSPAGWLVAQPRSGPPDGQALRAAGSSPELPQQLRLVSEQLRSVAASQHSTDLHQLLLYGGVAFLLLALGSVALSWWTAGRVLRPLRTITAAARELSATNLHERLALEGPEDELKELGDTFDQLLARLERSFEAERQFVANASHELRTPLATMRATLDVTLAKPGPLPPQTAQLAGRLHEELDQVDRLLEGFLLLARAQRGPAEEERVVALSELVAAAVRARAGDLSDRVLDLRVEDEPAALVRGNETLLARLVQNLVDNAVRHNVRGGWIVVSTALDDGTARLVVENGGPQLDEEAVRQLGRPFRRLGAERTGSATGFGLGLSIVAAIAETHGGRLELHAPPGGGLQALVELPRGDLGLGGGRGVRVLVVEDSRHLAEVIAEGLRDQGMAVDVAYDGTEAAGKVGATDYQVVVLDRDLPGIHGDALCAMITRAERPAMVLMLTAAATPGDRVAGLGLGADDYLAKPFHFPELVLRVRALARRQPDARARIYRSAGLELDPLRHLASREGRPLELSGKEFGLLEALLRAEGAVLSAEELLEQVWDEHADPFTNTVVVTVSRLRRKLGDPPVLETVPNVGYRISSTLRV